MLPTGRVAKALKLSARDLKHRRLAQQATLASPAPATDPAFIEVTPTGAGGCDEPSGACVELVRSDGLRMRIDCGAGALGELVRAFVAGERCFN